MLLHLTAGIEEPLAARVEDLTQLSALDVAHLNQVSVGAFRVVRARVEDMLVARAHLQRSNQVQINSSQFTIRRVKPRQVETSLVKSQVKSSCAGAPATVRDSRLKGVEG